MSVRGNGTTQKINKNNLILNLTIKPRMKTKNKFWIMSFIFGLLILCLATNCTEKENEFASENKDPSEETNKTEITIPIITTGDVTNITQTTAVGGGIITNYGGEPVKARGLCWSTSQTPTINNNKGTTDDDEEGSFTINIRSLSTNSKYYVRAFATNSAGTGYGNEETFITLPDIAFNPNITYGTLTDIDSNTYKTVTIGTQTWMAENLKVTNYNDGTSIPKVTDKITWRELTTGALCDYDNNPLNAREYGKLYNWYAVNTGNLCPPGWHVSSFADWSTLYKYLDRSKAAGGKLKEYGTTHWYNNYGASNETGFTALAGGLCYKGEFIAKKECGYWWRYSSDNNSGDYSEIVQLYYDNNTLGFNIHLRTCGLSVRCVRD